VLGSNTPNTPYAPVILYRKSNPNSRAALTNSADLSRQRQFRILVTTSVVGKQAYEEIRQDRHPVVLFCGRDLALILMDKGLNSAQRVRAWLAEEFPHPN